MTSKPPEMVATPLGIWVLTVAELMRFSSIQMEIGCPTRRPVASEKSWAPSVLRFSSTIGSLVWELRTARAEVTCLPSMTTGPVYSLPSRKVSSAVSPSSLTACSGLKSDSPCFQGKRTMMRSLLSST